MQKNTIIIGLLLLVVGLGVGYTLGGDRTSIVGNHMMPDGSMMGQNIDQHFIVQMIPHHEGAIEMARVALERSKRPEILSLANGIIESQQKEIDDMRGWYQSWYGSTPPAGGMGMMHMGSMEGDIDVLKTISASDFDRAFMEQMIPHHEMAIMMVQMLAAGTERAEMKQLAENIRTSQSREIDMMRSWLATWYAR
ncbi:hypothetical protein A3C18_00695 [Candidatus Kaiserbacteria bacterium RIFCSPHIGHO2_02_FULL_54_11b]|uniref:DUF305 domain-containing protein n=2 Tax=Candidatus Kaiseribacteriota TaxID=1752734 RepID=A0A1F6CMK1_9BACT|nr:MAG: hypothetical protein A2704_05430 [Candidatus Kaiserbacteria bacterium RIFCSPHIGHO2_01_FULL_54_36b]OGG64762.1 MAG: hypothetical protein A3C18_00695 [Candidatus Kaiserbacteria bacterium RIFCSPHIGHO2_02_FULL_54_11b]